MIKNYHSIGDELKIDFSTAASRRIGAFTDIGGLANKIACLVGPNASGKSNILRGIVSFLNYMCHSYARPELRELQLMPHFCCSSKPTEFSVRFIEDNVQFEYAISLFNNIVQSEYLKRFTPETKRPKYVFVRELNNEVKQFNMKINKSDLNRLTENVSLFSLLLWSNYWGNGGFSRLSKNMLTNVRFGSSFVFVSSIERIDHIAKALRQNKLLFEDLIEELKAIDTGISEIHPVKIPPPMHYATPIEKKEYDMETLFALHRIDENDYKLHLSEESAGTINFMELFIYLYPILRNGGILISDELEQSLHPDITSRILDIFLDKDKNPNNAQILFTTHNPWFLQYLTKTQIFIVEKNDKAETEITRLDEIKGVRNDENYFLKYINGEYDGKPKINER